MEKFSVLKLCFVALLVFFLTSCQVVFDEPLFSRKGSKIDKRLLGKWKNADPNEKQAVNEIVEKENAEINIISPDDKTGAPTVIFKAVSGKIDDENYLALTANDKVKGNLIAKYEIQNDEISLWILNDEKIKKALKQNN